jgi:hypothetical protein
VEHYDLDLVMCNHIGLYLPDTDEIEQPNNHQAAIAYLTEASNLLAETKARGLARAEAAADRQKAVELENLTTGESQCRELDRKGSTLSRLVKESEKKLFLGAGNGWLARVLMKREERKVARENGALMEKKAWEEGEKVWRMSMLDSKWWAEKGQKGGYHPVWNHVKHDLAAIEALAAMPDGMEVEESS